MIKILLVDDQTIFCEGLKSLLEKDQEISVVGMAANGREAADLCASGKPDIVLMDIVMPECDGIEGTKLIKTRFPDIKIIILTTFNEVEKIQFAMENGADGYVLKDINPEELISTIKSTFMGLNVIDKNVFGKIVNKIKVSTINPELELPDLTEREYEIIRHITEGKENKEIAADLSLSEGTIRNAISVIFQKLQVKDRVQLAVFAVKNSML